MKFTKIVNLKTVVLAASMMAPVAFAEGIDASGAVGYITGGLAAVALIGAALLGLDNLKKVWSKLSNTRV